MQGANVKNGLVNQLHGVMSQEKELFITTAVRISDSAQKAIYS
jgi:hypothetical protein